MFAKFSMLTNAQEWHQVYFPDKSNSTYAVYEGYDHGYILGGDFRQNSIPMHGLVIKTDLNGDMLWHKVISSNSDNTSIRDINETTDGGCVFTGFTAGITGYWNPFTMKLNSCGELEWCNIYNTPSHDPEWGQSIFQTPSGYIALFKRYGEDPQNQRIWLYKFDQEGDLFWAKCYAQSDTLIRGEISVKMFLNNESHFLINGYCYYPNPGNPNNLFLRPLLIKTDSTGVVDWELPWVFSEGENYYGQSYMSVFDNEGNIFSSGRHIITEGPLQGDKPALIKTDENGNEISYSDLLSETYLGLTYTINWFTDSSLVFGAGWINETGGDEYVGVIKTDKTGSVQQIKEMFFSAFIFSDAETTFDNKLLLVGGFWDGIWRSYAYKLNSNLEYDSIYTQPFIYDSLCPYPIPSDTIPLDCVVVGINDPFAETEKSRLKVYPNPASTILHIEIPTYLKTSNQTQTFIVTTIHYQWDQTRLEIYNLFGQLIMRKEIPVGEKLVDVDVSGWKKGMYVVKLMYGKEGVGNAKVVIQ